MTARHTRGYSIHSPYLFEIANSILPDRNAYYCFSHIEAQSPSRTRAFNNKVPPSASRPLSPRHNQILFKLALYTQARQIIEVGADAGKTTAYLRATHSQTQVHTYPEQPKAAAWDMAVLHDGLSEAQTEQAAEVLFDHAHDRSLMVVDGIRTSAEKLGCWHRLCTQPRVTATMDLGTMGLVFFDPHFEKKTYRIRI